jgi:hypothetical protein
MIGFICTSLQLQLIITAHTLNSFWTTSVWRISMKNLSLISDWSFRVRVTLRLAVHRQSIRLSDKPHWDPRPQLLFSKWTPPYVTSFLTRGWICRLQFQLVLASAIILSSESRGTQDHILLSQIRDSLNIDGPISVFISPWNRMARLYPQALGSFFVTSYDSQGYGGGIRPRLHTNALRYRVPQI